MAASVVMLWIVLVVQAFLVAGCLRQIGLIQIRLGTDPGVLITSAGLSRGLAAPDVGGADVINGAIHRVSDYRQQLLALIFLSPSCQTCTRLIPHINAVAGAHEGELRFLIVCQGTDNACLEFARQHVVRVPVIADLEGRLMAQFETTITPFGFLIDPEGRVLIRGVVNDWTQLEALLVQEGTFERGLRWSAVPTNPAKERLEVEALSSTKGGAAHG